MGGGNNLNLIRIPSLNEFNTIINSDLNGMIIPKDDNVWHFDTHHYMWTQNDEKDLAHAIKKSEIEDPFDKSRTFFSSYMGGNAPIYFCPVIEYRE